MSLSFRRAVKAIPGMIGPPIFATVENDSVQRAAFADHVYRYNLLAMPVTKQLPQGRVMLSGVARVKGAEQRRIAVTGYTEEGWTEMLEALERFRARDGI
ncbi:MAG: hypothetical protein AB7I33_12035 [Gemmatimonadales bacterium]